MRREDVAMLGAIAILAFLLLAGAVTRPQAGRPDLFPIPTPDPAEQARDAERYASVPEQPLGFIGARLGAEENQVSDAALVFDRARYDTDGFWDEAEPTRLTFPRDGFYRVGAQVTVLGSGYAGAIASPDWGLSVVRNADPTDLVCFVANTDEDREVAQAADCSTTDWFLAGDFVEVFVEPARLVESNWPGRGNVSPVLTAELVGE